MAVVLTNNASSRLAVALTAGATSFSVTSGEGAKYPSVAGGSGNWFPLTLIKASGSLEIVRCTARAGDVFTVTRAQEGTSAQAFSVGDRVELRLTSASIGEIQQSVADLRSDALLDANNLSDLADKAASRVNLGLKSAAVLDAGTNTGNVMPVGSFGLGAGSRTVLTNPDSSAIGGGFNYYNDQSGGSSQANNRFGIRFSFGTGLNQGFELLADPYSPDFYLRYSSSTPGAPWFAPLKIHHSGSFSSFVNTYLASANAAAGRSTLGLGDIATLNAKQACTAWVNFNGQNVVAIREAFNVSSITDNGVGDYTLNFTQAMVGLGYTLVGSCNNYLGSGGAFVVNEKTANATTAIRNTTSAPILVTSASGTLFDQYLVSVEIFGGK